MLHPVQAEKLNKSEFKALYYNLFYDNSTNDNSKIYGSYPAFQGRREFKNYAIDHYEQH